MEGDRKAADPRLPGCAISIHSLRMEGDAERTMEEVAVTSISIHSLRMEGDALARVIYPPPAYFNPLPPHGGRPGCNGQYAMEGEFQSTPSAWRETVKARYNEKHYDHFNPLPPHGGRLHKLCECGLVERISIHSLRMEGDVHNA